MRRTIYIQLAAKRTGKPLGVARLKRLADDVVTRIPRHMVSRARGDYVAGGTRYLDATPGTRAQPVLKVRGDDGMRNLVVLDIAKVHRVVAIHGHDRTLIGGKR